MREEQLRIKARLRLCAFFALLGLSLTTAGHVMAQQQQLTVTGVRTTQGNAVECPMLRTEDGRDMPVHGLPATIGIGDRVRITGTMVNPTTCLGPALNVEALERL